MCQVRPAVLHRERRLVSKRTYRYLRFCLVFLTVGFIATDAAYAQTEPTFRQPTGGGPRLEPTCQVQSLIGRGGVINLVSPEAEAIRRREKVRGVSTRLIELDPIRTDLEFSLSVEGPDEPAISARLDAQVASLVAALQENGHRRIAREAGPTVVVAQDSSLGVAPLSGTRKIVLGLEGDIDPLQALATLPDAFSATLADVSYEMPRLDPVIATLRPEFERDAREDAAARAAVRGDGVTIGRQIDLQFLDDDSGVATRSAARRMIPVSAVATYTLSRPPGSSVVSE